MGNSMSEREKNEAEFGEKIYEIVHEIYPESCENITGMLLEEEYDELERLLTTTGREELEARIHQAAKNLSTSTNMIPERAEFEQAKNIDSGNHSNKKPCPSHHRQIHLQKLPESYKSSLSERRQISFSGNSTDQPRTLENKQALGEKIYSLIEKQHASDAEVLTGVLLEMDIQSLEQLIKNTDLLEQKVDEVLAVLQNNSGQTQNGQNELVLKQRCDKSVIGEELYELVSAFNSEQADKITGMLLEMDVQDLEVIVKNQAALEEKVNQALTALNSHLKQPETSSLAEEEPDKTLYGEQLYCLISEWYPEQADKITGMLLELDVATLNLLLKDSAALRDKALHATNTLCKTNAETALPGYLAVSQETEDKIMSESKTKHSLATQLYNIIKEWYPDEAWKLTEMLMDSDKDCATLETLVLNKQLLREKIEAVLDVEHRMAQTVLSRESTKNEGDITKQELGGKLFEMVEELCPKKADKITGMLLEMSMTDIENLMKNPQKLEEKIQLAEKTLA